MGLLENIKAINNGGIFQSYEYDAILFNSEVIKEDKYVGLSDRKVNYFYTRHDDKPLKLGKAKQLTSSCSPFEVAFPKVLVVQFKDYELNGIMFAILNLFQEKYGRFRYEVNQVEIRKDFILKQETKELKTMQGYELIKFSYMEYETLNNCNEITCK